VEAGLERVPARVYWKSDHDDDGGGVDVGLMMARRDHDGSGDGSDGEGSAIVIDQLVVPLCMKLAA